MKHREGAARHGRAEMLLLVLVGCGSGWEASQSAPDAVRLPIDAAQPSDAPGLPPAATDAAPSSAPSCAGLAPVCGSTGRDSCCDSPLLPAGAYLRSFDVAGDRHSGLPTHRASVSGYRLDRFEVTVARFRAFVAAGGATRVQAPLAGAGAHPELPASGWDPSWNVALAPTTTDLLPRLKCDLQTWTDAPGDNELRPMNCVNWYEAMAFCIWDGGYLATEAEWNYAAAGGDEQRPYPWSLPAAPLELDPTHASYFDGTDCVGDGEADCAVTDLVTVGSKPLGSGRWQHADLAGNVAEWTLDWLAPYTDLCVDCANLVSATNRVVRGGAAVLNDDDLRTGARAGLRPLDRNGFTGIRCARGP